MTAPAPPRFAAHVALSRQRFEERMAGGQVEILAREYKRSKDGKFAPDSDGDNKPLTGQAALDAAPAKHTPDPDGHGGSYDNARLEGPEGMGTARALSEYEGVEYQTTNTTLRGGYRKADPGDARMQEYQERREREVAERVADIDQTMSASRLTSDVEVERVIQHGAKVFGDDWYRGVIDWKEKDFDEQDRQFERWEAGERPNLTGMKWREKGYVSTTADPAVTKLYGDRFKRANSSSEGEPVAMTIRVPKGTGAVQLSPIAHGPKGPTSEAELLLQRDLNFVVTADHGIDESGVRRLDIEVVSDAD